MKLSRLISGALVSLAVMSLAGCANTMYDMRAALGNTMLPGGAPFSGLMEKTPSEAVIYIYRPVGWAEVPDVLVNKSNLSALAEGAFFVQRLQPGQFQILIQRNQSRAWSFGPIGVTVTADVGERRFFRLGTGISGVLITPIIGGYSQQMRIEEVPEAVALQELSKLRSMR